jgi:hypothetical protein
MLIRIIGAIPFCSGRALRNKIFIPGRGIDGTIMFGANNPMYSTLWKFAPGAGVGAFSGSARPTIEIAGMMLSKISEANDSSSIYNGV